MLYLQQIPYKAFTPHPRLLSQTPQLVLQGTDWGNPLTYFNGNNWTLTWKNGRQLATATKTGTSVSYGYDLNGLRTSKKVGGVTHTYLYAGGQLLRETYISGRITRKLDFLYDQNGRPYALNYTNGTTTSLYYYVLNLQGDVIQLVGTDGNIAASYRYDPWGRVISATGSMANINPLRYRGYYYDTETGFYYLQSRYYDPTVCRFINADFAEYSAVSTLDDTNLFAYCSNNPVSRDDSDGEFWNIVVGAIGGALISGGVQIVSNLISGNKWSDGLGTAVLTGAASGALAATGVGLIGSIAGNAAISMAGNAANQVIKNKGFNNFDVGDMLVDGIIGGVSGAVGGRGMGKAANISTLNKNLTKKLFSGSSKVVGNGIKYYVSQTKAIYINFLFKPLRKSGVASLIGYGAKALFSGVK